MFSDNLCQCNPSILTQNFILFIVEFHDGLHQLPALCHFLLQLLLLLADPLQLLLGDLLLAHRLKVFLLDIHITTIMSLTLLLLFVGCLTSQQHASVSQGRVCSDKSMYYHTEIDVADRTFYLTRSQYKLHLGVVCGSSCNFDL